MRTKRFDEATWAFLNDCAMKKWVHTRLTIRFERAGVRSASKQQAILKELQAAGLIRVWLLQVNRTGRPWSLVELTEVGWAALGLTPFAVGRGNLPTRAATALLEEKLRRPGWTVVREGQVAGKQSDVVSWDPDGRLFVWEIANSADHEAANALHVIRHAERLSGHIVVCLSKKTAGVVERRFGEHEELAGDPRVQVTVLSKVLADLSWLDDGGAGGQ